MISLQPDRQTVWHELQTEPQDLTIIKNRLTKTAVRTNTPGRSRMTTNHLRYACHDHGQVVQKPGAFRP